MIAGIMTQPPEPGGRRRRQRRIRHGLIPATNQRILYARVPERRRPNHPRHDECTAEQLLTHHQKATRMNVKLRPELHPQARLEWSTTSGKLTLSYRGLGRKEPSWHRKVPCTLSRANDDLALQLFLAGERPNPITHSGYIIQNLLRTTERYQVIEYIVEGANPPLRLVPTRALSGLERAARYVTEVPPNPRWSPTAQLKETAAGYVLESRHAVATAAGSTPWSKDESTLNALAYAGLLEGTEPRGSQNAWTSIDWYFHATRRAGSNPPDFGTRAEPPPPPSEAVAPSTDTPPIVLEPLDFSAIAQAETEATFARRRSKHGSRDRAPALVRIAQTLHLSARNRAMLEPSTTSANGPAATRTYRRAYPSAGGLHTLDTWVIARDVRGLDAGIYRYDPTGHTLERRAGNDAAITLANWFETHNGGIPTPAMLVATARLEGIAWKYENHVYALALLEAGAWMEAVTIAASAVGLAACPLAIGSLTGVSGAACENPEKTVPIAEIAIGVP